MMLQELIQKEKVSLTPIDWQIYDYLTTSSNHKLTMSQVAENVHVSTTTIFRFCKKLGLSGFGELRAILKNQTPQKISKRDLVQATYHEIVDYIQSYDSGSLKERMASSQEIYIYAHSELELRIAKAFQRIFFPLNKPIFILPSSQALEASFSNISNQVLFIISADSQDSYPLILQNTSQMEDVYSVLLSDIRYIPIIIDQHLLIPTISDNQELNHYQMIITPYILALEMLYLKLQLGI